MTMYKDCMLFVTTTTMTWHWNRDCHIYIDVLKLHTLDQQNTQTNSNEYCQITCFCCWLAVITSTIVIQQPPSYLSFRDKQSANIDFCLTKTVCFGWLTRIWTDDRQPMIGRLSKNRQNAIKSVRRKPNDRRFLSMIGIFAWAKAAKRPSMMIGRLAPPIIGT